MIIYKVFCGCSRFYRKIHVGNRLFHRKKHVRNGIFDRKEHSTCRIERQSVKESFSEIRVRYLVQRRASPVVSLFQKGLIQT